MVKERTPEEEASVASLLNAINGFKVDDQGRLTWKDGLVHVQKRITLSRWQTAGAIIVAAGALSQGALAAFQLGCAFALWSKGCPR